MYYFYGQYQKLKDKVNHDGKNNGLKHFNGKLYGNQFKKDATINTSQNKYWRQIY